MRPLRTLIAALILQSRSLAHAEMFAFQPFRTLTYFDVRHIGHCVWWSIRIEMGFRAIAC